MSSKQLFLETKAENFKNYINSFSPSPSVKTYIDGFSNDQLIPTIVAKLIPLATMGGFDSAATKLIEELVIPEAKTEEVKNKIIAYMNMFVNLVLA